jgi:hypothetical protein
LRPNQVRAVRAYDYRQQPDRAIAPLSVGAEGQSASSSQKASHAALRVECEMRSVIVDPDDQFSLG